MGLTRLSAKCRACPFVEKCDHKEMEALAYLEPVAAPPVAEMVQPMAVKHDYRDIKIGENTTITIDVEELKRHMKRDFYKNAGLGLNFGA